MSEIMLCVIYGTYHKTVRTMCSVNGPSMNEIYQNLSLVSQSPLSHNARISLVIPFISYSPIKVLSTKKSSKSFCG